MEDGNNIKSFSAADIERYHNGSMPVTEMHALEKAAMDDPFLADALDGYKIAGANASADLADIHERLKLRTGEDGKVIAMNKRPGYYWMRVAAMIVVVAGAGVLAYTILNKKETAVAKEQNINIDSKAGADSVNPVTVNALTDSLSGTAAAIKHDTVKYNFNTNSNGLAVSDTVATTAATASGEFFRDSATVTESFANTTKDKSSEVVTSAPAAPSRLIEAPSALERKDNSDNRKQESDLVVTVKTQQADRRVQEENFAKKANYKKANDIRPGALNGVIAANKNALDFKSKADTTFNYRNLNVFRGRVVDVANNPVSFANVNIPDVNVGTYADAKGYFTLVAPDSVLNVNLRAVGFNNTQMQLRNNLQSNQVVLQEDKSLEAIVMSNAKPNTSRSRTANMVLNEPEPDDGWEKYDSYLANNIKVPQIDEVPLKEKESGRGVVELSFDVNKDGEPVNIKITKSLCKECDAEAIRLVKDGPKWKKKNKKGKATVTVAF